MTICEVIRCIDTVMPLHCGSTTGTLGFYLELDTMKLNIAGMIGFGIVITVLNVLESPVCASIK